MTNRICKYVITVEIFTKKQWVICLNTWKTFHCVVWPFRQLVLWRTEVCHKHWLRYLQLESKIIIRKKWIVPYQWNVTIWTCGDWLLRFAVMLLATWHKYHSILGSPFNTLQYQESVLSITLWHKCQTEFFNFEDVIANPPLKLLHISL